jgi:hypothetical protein
MTSPNIRRAIRRGGPTRSPFSLDLSWKFKLCLEVTHTPRAMKEPDPPEDFEQLFLEGLDELQAEA